MKKSTQFIFGLILASVLGVMSAKADHLSDRLTFSARLQAAPGVVTSANGVGAFMLNSTRDTMYFTISFAKLSSPLTGIHIHNGRTGGNVIIDFDGMVERNTVRSFITGTELTGLLNDFMVGNLYVAVHSTMNPAVEIFGTIKLETDWGFAAAIDGTQAATASMAMGHASLNFGMKGDTAIIRVATNLTNKIESVHLHSGKAGQSGGVILDLSDLIAADSISLVGGVSLSAPQWINVLACLMADSVYINFHTDAFAGGEIRGQVRSTKTLRFDSWLNPAAIVAGGGTVTVPSTGYGISTMWLNNTMDTLRYNVFFTGLTSSADAAHFHNAEANTSGGVVKEVTISGNTITGMWTKSDATNPLTAAMVSQLLQGSLYLVVHTSSNPGGEIRGQVYRLAREGFIAEINGMQAATNSMALGTAIASYDRNRTNLHSMISIDNLEGSLAAGHIHAGVKGASGGVLIDLDPFTDNGSYLYSKAAEGFTESASIAMRRNDSSYVNIHTSTAANGEARGQLMRYYRISSPSVTTGLANTFLSNGTSVKIYPNPVQELLTISLDVKANANAQVFIYDINGKMLSEQEAKLNNGNNQIEVNTTTLGIGIYIVELQINGAMASHTKLIKN
jgi:hypothetical protein